MNNMAATFISRPIESIAGSIFAPAFLTSRSMTTEGTQEVRHPPVDVDLSDLSPFPVDLSANEKKPLWKLNACCHGIRTWPKMKQLRRLGR